MELTNEEVDILRSYINQNLCHWFRTLDMNQEQANGKLKYFYTWEIQNRESQDYCNQVMEWLNTQEKKNYFRSSALYFLGLAKREEREKVWEEVDIFFSDNS